MKKEVLKPIVLNDITKYRFPGNPIYSPDGKNLAFHVKRSDVEKNCYHSDIWLYPSGSRKPARQVTFSLDASLVAWKNENEIILARQPQDGAAGAGNSNTLPETTLFLLDIRGGEAKPWLKLPFVMLEFRKVTDTIYVATGLIDREDPDLYKASAEVRKQKAEALQKDKDYTVVDEVPYWFNGAGFTNGRRTALFAINVPADDQAADTGALSPKIKRLTAPTFDTGALWVEGQDVYYAGHRFERLFSLYDQIYCWHAATGKTEKLYGKSLYAFSELFVLNGHLYVFASDMKTYGLNETSKFYELKDGQLELVYSPFLARGGGLVTDTVMGGGRMSAVEGGQYLTLITNADHNAIYSFDGDKDPQKLWDRDGLAACLAVSSKKIALCCQGWDEVCEVYEMERDGSKLRKVTDLNGAALAGRYIAKPEPLPFKSTGESLKGWVLLPQNYDPKKQYPAVLDIHGGPRGAFGETFMHEMQAWAGLGFIVFFTNIRGSDGRGDAFADIRGKYGTVDYQNLMDFTDCVLAKYPNIDKNRVCVTGGSYGGFMTNWIIGHTHRFCCAASQRSIANWISKSFISDIGPYFNPDQNGAASPFDFEPLWEHSPLKYSFGATTPTLFIHSDEDYRCPLPEGMQMMQSLRLQGVPTRLVIFHGENHELSRSGKPQHRLRRLQEITDWFLKYTK